MSDLSKVLCTNNAIILKKKCQRIFKNNYKKCNHIGSFYKNKYTIINIFTKYLDIFLNTKASNNQITYIVMATKVQPEKKYTKKTCQCLRNTD